VHPEKHTRDEWWSRLGRVLDLHGPLEAALYLVTAVAVVNTVTVIAVGGGTSRHPVALAVSSLLVLCLCLVKLTARRRHGGRALIIVGALLVAVATFAVTRLA
jgi:hypothetical protein